MQNRDFLHGESGVVKEGNKGALAAVLVAFKVLGWITTEVQQLPPVLMLCHSPTVVKMAVVRERVILELKQRN